MNNYRPWLVLGLLLVSTSLRPAEPKTFYLQNGESITGEVLRSEGQQLVVKTAYGELTINTADLVEKVSVLMENGDKIKGQIILETREKITIISKMGTMTIPQNEIMRIDYQNESAAGPVKFTLANEKQVDVFYDPTGFVLDDRVLYVSGLSWGFGLSPRLQLMSRWVDYLWGNFNVKPKYQLFHRGSWEKEQALSVGLGFNTRYINEYLDWTEGKVGKTGYYGAYTPIGSTVDAASMDADSNYISFNNPDPKPYYEVFAAYSLSRAHGDRSGRITHTIGGRVGKLEKVDDLIYRVYYAGGFDIRKNLILNYEIFYDPFYVEIWNRSGGLNYYDAEIVSDPVHRPDISPWHIDIGFIYAYSDWLRFGIHFQPYILAVYMKF